MYCFAKNLLKKQKIKFIWQENDDRNFRYKKSTSWCYLLKWSGKRGSNSRPRPWQGRALPTELFPHFTLVNEATLYEKIYSTQVQILQMIEFA